MMKRIRKTELRSIKSEEHDETHVQSAVPAGASEHTDAAASAHDSAADPQIIACGGVSATPDDRHMNASGPVSAQGLKAFGERLYRINLAVDDAKETIAQLAMDILDPVVLIGELVAKNIRKEMLVLTGQRHMMARDRRFEHRMQEISRELRESQVGGAVEAVTESRKRTEKRLDRLEVRRIAMVRKVEIFFDKAGDSIRKNRKRVSIVSGAVVGCFLAFCVTVNAGTVYTYSYHGEELGTVKDKAEIAEATEQVTESVPENEGIEVEVKADPTQDITYEKDFDLSAAVDSTQDIVKKLASCDELEGEGYEITIDGTVYAYVDTEETADKVLTAVRETRCTVPETADQTTGSTAASASASATAGSSAGTAAAAATDSSSAAAAGKTAEVDQSAVTRNIVLAQVAKSAGVISEGQDAVNKETGTIDAVGAAQKENSTATTGSSYAGIDFSAIDATSLEGVSLDNVKFKQDVEVKPVTAKVSQFMDYNEAIQKFISSDGTVTAPVDLLTSEIVVYPMPVDYETVYQDSDTLYVGETQVQTAGVIGTKQVTAYLTREDGNEVGRVILNEAVTAQPTTQVILNGTAQKPSYAATGSFIMPTNGTFSSGFGYRWGKLHQGVDIANSYGSDIYAADSGTVIYAQYNPSGYGNLVKIDHGNGVVTYYGHCSQIDVTVGQKVLQGQLIAQVGSTGNSTGNHCHFEIRINGTPVNPISYLQ